MAKDPRLEKLRNMDPVISTFTARDLVSSPGFVDQTYLEHVQTHMSLGDTSSYVSGLLRWVQTNKGAVVGAVSGEYGYGKTSMALHLWQKCEQARVVAVPPFEWYRLQDIIDATWAWVRYRVGKIQPGAVAQIDQCYGQYREKSIQEFADEEGISVSKVQDLVDRGRVNLGHQPSDVIEFISKISQLLENDDLRLYGPVVFTDELQVTMSRYQDEHRSRDDFMEDIFELLNGLSNQQGSFGLMIGLPLNTETLINSVRPDILQRLQRCGLLIRPSTMYERSFPQELWGKFAQVFEFEDIATQILPHDTLDSMGQVAFRGDLGAGPRTVIQAMRCAIDHYDQSEQSFSPIDLLDAYLARQVAFDSGGKLVTAVTEVLQSKEVKSDVNKERAIKLMAAFPMGCPEERFQVYDLQETQEQIARQLYTEYLYKFPEGISLRKLAPTERPAEPRFVELTKAFIQTYSESERDLQAAAQAFDQVIIQEQLMASRRADQIEGWIPDAQVAGQYVGTFDRRYPERRLMVRISNDRSRPSQKVHEFGLVFWFDSNCDHDTCGRIERGNEEGTLAIFRLNLLRRSHKPFNIPYIEELGYSLSKVTPAFMLALVNHLRKNSQAIPEDEKRLQIPPFERALVDYSIQLLLGEDMLENTEFDDLSKVGLPLVQEVFVRMCQASYPAYQTFITTGRWQQTYAPYLNALGSQAVSSSVSILRGNKPFEATQREVLTLLGETRVQAFKGAIEALSGLLEAELGNRADAPSKVRFRLHPAEEAFMQALRASEEKFVRDQVELRAWGQHEGLDYLRNLGYREEEIGIILQLLKTRRLVNLDTRRQRFEEVLESPIERREALLASISDLSKRADVLSKIPDFDHMRFTAQIEKLTKEVSASEDIEALEEYQAQLVPLRDVLEQFTRKWANKIHDDLEQVNTAVGQVIRATLPADLTRSLKSDVNWVGELVQCQALLKDKYQRAVNHFRDLGTQAISIWNAWKGSSAAGPAALLVLYEANLVVQTGLKEAEAEMQAAKSYLTSYVAWSNVLNTTSRAYREATSCEISYKEEQFRLKLDGVLAEIVEQFQKKRLEALPNHEMYADQIIEVQSSIDAWLRGRRDGFIQAGRFYEEKLKACGVERYNLRSSFDPFDPATSYSNLYSEVLEKARQQVDKLEQELEGYRTDALYAERVVGTDVSSQSSQIAQTLDRITQVRKLVHNKCVQDQTCFAALGDALSQVNVNIQSIEQSLRGILQKRTLTPEEEAVWNLLQDPRGTDLKNIIVSQLASSGDEFSLDKLMQDVLSLFKKNQIVVRLEKVR